MSPALDQLVRDVAAAIGVPRPTWLDDDAPVLAQEFQSAFYLVGLIGGKDVGKSALVNAIVGHEITARTSFGPGTETVVAYAHESQVAALRDLLDREVPGRFTMVPHTVAHLQRQVLLDLPDVDSHWADHLTVTRRMLRHMLFPVWVQSVEKYADRQPQELLTKVAAGNAPANFVFCLNKIDQVKTPGAIAELQSDYASRLQRVLSLDSPPKVWPIAAIYPDRYELPALRDLLAQQKSEATVRDSLAKAALRQKSSVLKWLDEQDLPARAQRLARLEDQAREVVNDRLGGPLLENVLEKLLDDPLHRQTIIDDCLAKRVSRWPILNVLHPLYSAIAAFFRRNAEATARPLGGPAGEALVDNHLRGAVGAAGRSLGDTIQATFAMLQQSSPQFSELYADRKFWDAMPATLAAGQLRDDLIATVDRQRGVACEKLNHPGGGLASLVRGLLTIGALIWFPFAQPLLRALLARYSSTAHPAASPENNLPLLFVDLLSINNLLGSLTFLLIYFTILWLILRWDTQRRVHRQFARWKRLENQDPQLSLASHVLTWLDALLEPLQARRRQFDDLSKRVEDLRKSMART